jgi:hypothetical protein
MTGYPLVAKTSILFWATSLNPDQADPPKKYYASPQTVDPPLVVRGLARDDGAGDDSERARGDG